MSARNFSKQLGVADNNTQNYISSTKPAVPNADYLERILHHFQSINPGWLLTGNGAPFIPDSSPTQTHETNAANTSGKNFSQNLNSGINTGTVGNSTGKGQPANSEQLAALQRENELLRSQLADKEHIIRLLSHQQPK